MGIKNLLLTILLIGACTPTTRVRVLKPPQVNIKNIQKIALIDLDALTVYDRKITNDIRQHLLEKLKKNTSYQYLDSQKTDSILKKEKFAKKDYQNSSYADRVSSALGVDTLIYGTVLAYDSRDEVEHIKGDRDPSTGERLFKDRLKFTRVVDVAIKFEISSVGGDKPFVKTISAVVRSEEEGLRDGFAKAALLPEEKLFKEALNEVCASLIHLIAPHYIEEEWPLKEGEHPELKKGIAYAIEGKWDQAKNSWKKTLAEENLSLVDRNAAWFNLGLLAESQGKLDKAEEIFQKLYEKNKDSTTQDVLNRIKERRKQK